MVKHTHTASITGEHRHFIANTDANKGADILTNFSHLMYQYTNNSSENYKLMGSKTDSRVGLTSANANHIHSISATGGNQPHENRPPYMVINRWKRTA